MNKNQIEEKLRELLSIGIENEVMEFKTAKNSFHFDELGKYFSALSNEANLRGAESAWLIFGVDNKGKIIGTNYRSVLKDLHNLKHEIATKTNGNITFREIYDLNFPEGRVVLFEIPPAHLGTPTTFDGHAYAREGDSLVALNQEKHKPIEDAMAKKLKSMALIDGRKPHYLVSFHLADDAQKKVTYLKNKAFDDTHYKNMIIDYIKKYKQAKRSELDLLLMDKLPDILNMKQKKNKITNLIQALKKQNKIKKANDSDKDALWISY